VFKTFMNPASVDPIKANANMVTHAFIVHFAVPAFIGILLIGLAAIAWEIVKSGLKSLFGKKKTPKPRGRYY
jgi:hypothetical protein